MPSLLLLDNFDSFTYNLYDYLTRVGFNCTVISNNVEPNQTMLTNFNALVIGPGPGRPADSGFLFDYLKLFNGHKPILGVCLGQQAIGQYFGADVERAIYPVHGKATPIYIQAENNNPLFDNIDSTFLATRYHSLVLKNLPDALLPTAFSAEGEIMAIQHKWLPIYGVQFHPEAWLTQFGLQLLANYKQIVQAYNNNQLFTAPQSWGQ